MKKGYLFTIVFLMMGLSIPLPSAYSLPLANLYVNPPLINDPHLGDGASFNLDVLIANVSDLSVCEFNLTYKPTILSCRGVLITALDHSPRAGWEVNDYLGYVWINITYSIPVTTTSPVLLVTLIFNVQGKGSSPLDFASSGLVDSDGLPIPHQVTGGFFKNFNPYDLNQDGIVDIIDVSIVALAFGSTPSNPNWNPRADVNYDEIIDIFDLVAVTIHFGEI